MDHYPSIVAYWEKTELLTDEAAALNEEYMSAVEKVLISLESKLEPDIITKVIDGQLQIGLPQDMRFYITDELIAPLSTFVDRNLHGNDYHFYMGTVWSFLVQIATTHIMPRLASAQQALKSGIKTGGIFGGNPPAKA